MREDYNREIFSYFRQRIVVRRDVHFAVSPIVSLCFVKLRLFSFVPVMSFFQQVQDGARPIMTA